MSIEGLKILRGNTGLAADASGDAAPAAGQADPRLRQAVAGFEAQFLNMLLKSMRSTVPESGFFGERSLASSTWEEMMDQALADGAAQGGGLGLGDAMLSALARRETGGGNPADRHGFIALAAASGEAIAMPAAGRQAIPLGAAERQTMTLGSTSGQVVPAAGNALLSQLSRLAPALAGAARASGNPAIRQLAQQLAPATPATPATPTASPEAAAAMAAVAPRQLPADQAALDPELLKRLGKHDGGIRAAAQQSGVRPNLLRAVAAIESGVQPLARSHRGALGIMQLMPGTARELGVKNPFDAAENLRAGARYLSGLLNRFGGDTKLALAGYNAGPNAVARYGAVPPYGETRRYVKKVIDLLAKLDRAFPGQ